MLQFSSVMELLWSLCMFSVWFCTSANRRKIFDDLPRSYDLDCEGRSFFVYDFDDEFHVGPQERAEREAQEAGSNCDFMLSACTETTTAGDHSAHRQFGQEVIILRKFLSSNCRVHEPQSADFFVVPALIGTACILHNFLPRCLEGNIHLSIFSKLTYYSPITRHRHLFLVSLDMHNLPLTLAAHSLLVSCGASYGGNPGHIVVPMGVTDVDLQPKIYKERPRDVLFFLAQTPNNAIRQEMQKQLETFDALESEEADDFVRNTLGIGRRVVLVSFGRAKGHLGLPSSKHITSTMRQSVFCPCTPAENSAAGTKRMYDAILSGCLPVVISFKTVFGSGVSWWREDGPPLEWMLPFPWAIDWHRLVVEVPRENLTSNESKEFGQLGLILACRDLGPGTIANKQAYLQEVRKWLMYDLDGGTRDAFSLIMDGIRTALPQIAPISLLHSTQIPTSHQRSNPLVCEWLPCEMQMTSGSDFGQDIGKEKAWTSSFGNVACRSAWLWQPPSKLMVGTGNPLQFTFVVGHIVQEWDFQTPGGTTLLSYVFRYSNIEAGTEQQILASMGPLSFCNHNGFPLAKHETKLQALPRPDNITTLCLLINPVPDLHPPRASQGIDNEFRWQLVLRTCNFADMSKIDALIRDIEAAWTKMAPQHSLQVVFFDVCSAGLATITSIVLLKHILRIMYDQVQSKTVPDAVIMLSLPGNYDVVGPRHTNVVDFTLPDVILNAVIDRFLQFEHQRKDSKWLILFDGPKTSGGACDGFLSLFFSADCPLSDLVARNRDFWPQAFAFSTHSLSGVPTVDWEVAATAILSASGGSFGFQFGLIATLLSKALKDGGASESIVIDYSFSPIRDSLSVCISSWDQGTYSSLTGRPLSFGSKALYSHAIQCREASGSYALVETGLPTCLYAVPKGWTKIQLLNLNSTLGQLHDDHWTFVEAFGVCLPPLCNESHATHIAWHYLREHIFSGNPLSEAAFPLVPAPNALVRIHMETLGDIDAGFGFQ